MALGFEAAGGLAGGYGTLEQMLAARIEAQRHQEKLAQAAIENAQRDRQLGQGDRRMDIDVGQFDQSMGLNRDRFGLDQQKLAEEQYQFSEQAPVREAGRLHTIAQTADLQQRPQREAESRAHAAEMEDLRAGYRSDEQRAQHGYRLGEIGATGAQQRQTQAAAPAKPGQSTAGTTAQKAAEYTSERTQRAFESVEALLKKTNFATTGPAGITRYIPGTPAKNYAAELNTLKSAIAVRELNEMREASRTGGSLGNVSDREVSLLHDALGALDQDQSPRNMKQQLEKIKGSLERWRQAREAAGQQPDSPDMVPMLAPDGRELAVPQEDVAELEALGAVRR